MSKTGITCYRNGGCGPYEMYSCYECPASKSDYVQVKTAPKPTTHFDWIKSLSVEKLANVLTDDWCEILCGSPSVCDGQCEGKMLSWLKTPLNKEGKT